LVRFSHHFPRSKSAAESVEQPDWQNAAVPYNETDVSIFVYAIRQKRISKGGILSAQYVAERSPRRLPSPAAEECLFLRNNDYWIIRYYGVSAFLKNTRGLYYLAVMLREPRREFHVLELVVRATGVSSLAAAGAAHGHVRRGFDAAVPILDAKAKIKLKSRINDLQQELNEAERFNDFHRSAQAQSELQAIAEYLASAVGIGGRDRKTSSDAERARSAVTKCIRKAIEKIGDASPSLGSHLAARIKTGYFCSYNPHPDRPVAWRL
jgi:non-specific serine/threonine protein kinase